MKRILGVSPAGEAKQSCAKKSSTAAVTFCRLLLTVSRIGLTLALRRHGVSMGRCVGTSKSVKLQHIAAEGDLIWQAMPPLLKTMSRRRNTATIFSSTELNIAELARDLLYCAQLLIDLQCGTKLQGHLEYG